MDIPRTYGIPSNAIGGGGPGQAHTTCVGAGGAGASTSPSRPADPHLVEGASRSGICTPVVERMARAICRNAAQRNQPPPPNLEEVVDAHWPRHVGHVQAALAAAGEPTPEIISALTVLLPDTDLGTLRRVWFSVMERAGQPARKTRPVEGDEVIADGRWGHLLGIRKRTNAEPVAWVEFSETEYALVDYGTLVRA